MPIHTKEYSKKRTAEWENKIMATMKEHVVLHYKELNTLMGKHEKIKPYQKGYYSQALFNLNHIGKIAEVHHNAHSVTGKRRRSGGARTTVYYTLPAYDKIASWAKAARKRFDPNARTLLEMDEIAKAHPKGWIHYLDLSITTEFLDQNLVRKKLYGGGEGKKPLELGGKRRYVKTRKFNTAVRVLKKVLDHRGIPY